MRKILVTSALPYANGPIHIGHLVEYIQTDIWVRFQRMRGNDCLYICASDAHGTPIMLRARQDGISPEQLVEHYRAEHQRDFTGFMVDFDNFYTTHSAENRELVEKIFARLKDRGLIYRRPIEQFYDTRENMFLPDRYVRGICPHCGTADQYGDSCEACHRTYSPTDLREPQSVISGTPPELRESEHYFFRLGACEESLKKWVHSGTVDAGVVNKLDEWFEAGLQDWDISRDAPYFGFEIPDAPGKYFYVWLDAPVGYMASLAELAQRRGELSLDEYFAADSTSELYHFIGKDISYFHTLFWPAVLESAGYRKPSGVFVHGFLTVNGQKMSKSRGTFISGATYLEHLKPEYLRYYYAVKLGPGVDDIDLNLDDFVARVNADLVGKFVNIASRCAGFIARNFDGELAGELEDPGLCTDFVDAGDELADLYEGREFGRAMRVVMRLADRANQYIDERKPWVLVKNAETRHAVQDICTQGLNLFRILAIYLKPVLPAIVGSAEEFLGDRSLGWEDRREPLLGQRIKPYRPLITRVDEKAVRAMIAASTETPNAGTASGESGHDDAISIDEFLQIDLRVATVVAADEVDGADKLLRVTVDTGDQRRTVFAGIKSAYAPDMLVGRQVILVANLAPRQTRFGTSEGMLLAAGPGGEEIYLLSVDQGAKPGMRVR